MLIPTQMGSIRAICEIVEADEELNSSDYSNGIHQVKPHDKEKNPHILKQGYSKSLEDDINKLFEAVHRKTSLNGLSLSDESGAGPSRKNALKKPMRMSTSSSSGIGFSEPVSLKQALRGLCISQASEMAAMKRLSKTPGSPAVSESGRLANRRSSGMFEAKGSGASLDEVNVGRFEISLVPEESTSSTSGKMPQYMQEPKMKSYNNSSQSSPRSLVETRSRRMGSSPRQNEIVPASTECGSQPTIADPALKENNILIPSPPCNTIAEDAIKSVAEILSSVKLVANHDNQISKSSKLVNKAAPKLRRKSRLQSAPSSSTSSNSIKSTRNAPRAVKTVIRHKNIIRKKSKQDSTSAPLTFKASSEVKAAVEPNASQLICQRCQCHLKDAHKESSKDSLPPVSTNVNTEVSFVSSNNGAMTQGFSQGGCDRNSPVAVNNNKNSKCADKGEFTQSSKSSIGDYSSSTSISEESNLSVCNVGNRPHMSKDIRWQAVHHVMKQNGFLGLRHFNLLKKLGCGDIGTVYLAELIGTNCPFAIKVMDNEFLERRKKMPRAQTEREILRILDHPFLPTLYAHFVSDNLSCLVMEYCPGGDLHVLRQKQPGRFFHEQAARFYVAEVLLALEYLHMLGIVYRDLKPENILVREDGHIMLTDFDLSLRCSVSPTLMQSPSLGMEPPRMSGPCAGSSCIDPFCIKPTCQVSCFTPRLLLAAKAKKTKADVAAQNRSLPQLVAEPTDARSNSFVGTHEYLAPEIIKGDGHGSAVDWWTFGIFLYELLYGKTPFKGSGNEETLANVVLHSLKFPETPLVSLQARDLIKGLLVKEPENRLGSQRGAAEIKQHPFFDGLNWALIRCAVPPELPEPYEVGVAKLASLEKAKKYLDCGGPTGGQLEFELF